MVVNIQTAVNEDVMPCSAVGGYQHLHVLPSRSVQDVSQMSVTIYEGWNFNSGNYLFTADTK